jgi:hypothetical protein
MKAMYFRYAMIIILPLAVYLGSTVFYSRTYYERSDQLFESCLKQFPESSTCSHVTRAADRAFSLSTSYYNPVIIMLIVAMSGFAANNLHIRKELKELEEKLND